MKHWGRTKMIFTVLVTIALTVLVVVIAQNFSTPEKQLERRIEHHYAVSDPQFVREMSVLLGPVHPARQPCGGPAERR
jgi:cardiolipin synthase